ncbi:hypothetical protein MYP_1270 [Sporocytophaga myxococcoides]|uniref:Uncharacterized protein n=1 Tax=Sporocytophaga myxococcoides TaxID=153721 RepID=A0A098LC70_9BACT|nr:hypothetical protein [Sporocytophaga myxococcoides]GAL84042.1 hypothetical protein MYP_1270 [Sporocytophaga myxococcoides]
MKKTIKFLALFTLFTTSIVISVSAQDDPPCPPGGCDDEDPIDIPFDGGASMLLAAGIGIGGKKIYDSYKNRK